MRAGSPIRPRLTLLAGSSISSRKNQPPKQAVSPAQRKHTKAAKATAKTRPDGPLSAVFPIYSTEKSFALIKIKDLTQIPVQA